LIKIRIRQKVLRRENSTDRRKQELSHIGQYQETKKSTGERETKEGGKDQSLGAGLEERDRVRKRENQKRRKKTKVREIRVPERKDQTREEKRQKSDRDGLGNKN